MTSSFSWPPSCLSPHFRCAVMWLRRPNRKMWRACRASVPGWHRKKPIWTDRFRNSAMGMVRFVTHTRSYRYDNVLTWTRFLHYWPFVRGIRQSPMSPHKGPMVRFSSLLDWLNKQSRCRWFETPWRSCDVVRCVYGMTSLFVTKWTSPRGVYIAAY